MLLSVLLLAVSVANIGLGPTVYTLSLSLHLDVHDASLDPGHQVLSATEFVLQPLPDCVSLR